MLSMHCTLQHPSGKLCTSGTPGVISKTEMGGGVAFLSSSLREDLWDETALKAGDFEKKVG